MNKIVEIAKSYLGQEEISGNKGFKDKLFQSAMEKVGWYFRAPWCLYFCRLVWKESGFEIKRVSGSSLTTMLNATKDKNWKVTPVVGAIAIYRMFENGKPKSQGHGAIVVSVSPDGLNYETIDGNTTDKGGREGIMVAARYRSLNDASWKKIDGLRLMGFVHPVK